MSLHPVEPASLFAPLAAAMGAQNALLTAGSLQHCNTMTIGWCQLGRLWNRPVCSVFVRPERFTYQFMEENDCFSLSVLPPDYKDAMALCGSKSGRDLDKIKAAGLSLLPGPAPYFAEADFVLICRKLFAQDLSPQAVLPAGEDAILPFYSPQAGNWHKVYCGEMIAAYSAL
ncbi:MAG: flavin reductase family protein [Oscillibacter sp.]|nr:flavin reductase family protein [Oscillibacter sp.]